MPRIIRTSQAEIDLLELWCSIAAHSITAADKFLDTINGKLQTLSTQPKMGRLREEFAPSLRSFPVGDYVIFYQPLEDGIEVTRVIHGSRDLKNFL